MTEKELLSLKKQINEAKDTVNQLKGRLTYLNEQLKKDWKCDGIPEAEVLIQGMDKTIENLENQIEKQSNTLETQLEGNESN